MRYVTYLTAVCEHDGRTLKLVNFYLFKAPSTKPADWRKRAGKGELQVRRVGKAAGEVGQRKGKFEVVMEVFKATSNLFRKDEPHEQLWVRPEFARVATHVEDLQTQAAVLNAASQKVSDAPYREAAKLEQQANQLILTVARGAIKAFVELEKQVLKARKDAAQDAALAGDKTAADVVQLHGKVTSELLADGEEILRQLNKER